MRIYELETSLVILRPRPEVFAFFADAGNLQAITPPWLHFAIRTPMPVDLRPGARLDYRLRLHGVPILWRTEITTWDPPHRFVDEQLRGPYRLWVHTHTFTEVPGGTRVDDHVRYAVPGGTLIHNLFVRRDVQAIFEYRKQRLLEIFAGNR